jgi:hypothetical protein
MLIASLFALAIAAEAAPEAPARDPEIPASAPVDDYGFVAWCHGALSGHMALRPLVKQELDTLSPAPADDDEKQKAAGDMYLKLYSEAMAAAEKASPTAIKPRAQAASARGYGIWTAARNAEPRTRMWSYLMWELPPRCEIAAKRLEEKSALFAEALRTSPTAAPDLGPVATAQPDPATPGDGLRGTQ